MLIIKELRTKANLTQTQLADKLHVAQSTLALWENGNRQPSHEILIKLADYFGVSVDELLGIKDTTFTDDDFSNGVFKTKKVSITADEEEMLDKIREVINVCGEKGKDLIIDFCNMLLEKYTK